jgi:predicted dehydrogenase
MSQQPFRWGILGPGGIAKKFADGLRYSPGAVIGAVGSRSQERGDDFARQFGVPTVHASYEELVSNPNLDAIYIATPHSGHAPCAKLCIEHGKPVLVEKPFTINAAEAKSVIDLARSKGVFCMEGMWTRFFPAMAKLRELVKEGAIGEVKMIHADFGFRTDINPAGRIWDTALGGGALLDVGIYPVSFARMLLGIPTDAVSLANLGTTNVDEVTGIVLKFKNGAVAVLSTGIRVNTPLQAIVLGENGSIYVNGPGWHNAEGGWWKPEGLTIKRHGASDEIINLPYPGSGFQFEADEVQRCVRAGLLESPILPLSETLQIMELLDTVRGQIGLKYPAD